MTPCSTPSSTVRSVATSTSEPARVVVANQAACLAALSPPAFDGVAATTARDSPSEAVTRLSSW